MSGLLNAMSFWMQTLGIAAESGTDNFDYHCADCEVHGHGTKCWCCDSSDVTFGRPSIVNANTGVFEPV